MNRRLLIYSALMFLWFLWNHDFWAPDEPFFAEGAREMLVDGHWLVTHINGQVNSHKPPLFFWLIALFSIPMGEITEFTARLPSALAAIATVAITYQLGRRWYGEKTALLAGVLLVTMNMFWDKARWTQIDSLLCCLIWCALFAFHQFWSKEMGGRVAGSLFWLAVALAVLAKGPIGLLIPLGVALATLVSCGQVARWKDFAPLQGPLLFLALTGTWVFAASTWGPSGYSVIGALREHFLERAVSGMHHAQPFWYYAKQLPLSLLPWTGLLPGAIYLAWLQRKQQVDRLAVVTFIFVLAVFTVSTEKRDLYVLPAFPALALLMARLVGRLQWDRDRIQLSQRWVTLGIGCTGALLLALGGAILVLGRNIDEVSYTTLVIAGGILIAGGTLATGFSIKGMVLKPITAMTISISVLYLFASATVYPQLESAKSGRSFAQLIKTKSASVRAQGRPILALQTGNLTTAFSFYSNGVYFQIEENPRQLEKCLMHREENMAITSAKALEHLPQEALDRIWVIDKTRLSRRDVYFISNTIQATGYRYSNNPSASE